MIANTLRYTRLMITALLLLSGNLVKADAESVSVQEAASLSTQQHAIIVDVRELAEWQKSHIPNAIHIPLGDLEKRLPELAQYKNSPIITQCRSGKRSLQAAKALKSAGFSEVYNMDGGLNAWQKAGLPSQ